jgi:hypothetical protein
MEEISSIAAERMNSAAHQPNMQYAEILFMTQDEATEFLALRLSLPTQGQERQAARARIDQKIKARQK